MLLAILGGNKGEGEEIKPLAGGLLILLFCKINTVKRVCVCVCGGGLVTLSSCYRDNKDLFSQQKALRTCGRGGGRQKCFGGKKLKRMNLLFCQAVGYVHFHS